MDGRARQIQTPIGYYPTQKEANLALAKYNANPYNIDHAKLTWEGVYLLWEEKAGKKISAGTLNNYRSQWNKLKSLKFHTRIPRNETVITLQNFVDSCCPTQPQKNSMKIFLSQLYNEALKHDIVQKDYSSVNELTRKRMLGHSVKNFTDKVYTDTDYDDLMKAIKLFDDFAEENLLLICSLPSKKTV